MKCTIRSKHHFWLLMQTALWTWTAQQARSLDFVQEGANLARAQGTRYQKPKTPRIWFTIFWGPGQFIYFFYFYYDTLFYFSAQGGGGGGMAPCPPLG